MAATLLRLRARTLGHTLRRETWRAVLLGFGVVWALSTLPSVVAGMVWVSRQSPDVGHDVLVVAGSLLVVGWALIPVLVPGLDDSLDITRFATFGVVPVRRLVPGLLAASLLGLPTAFTALVALAPVIAWAGLGGWRGALVALVAAPLALLTCVLASRLSTGVATRLLGSRRSRELGAVLGLIAVGLVVPAVVAVGSLGLEGALERVPAVAAALGWTPLGAVWAAPAAMAQGDALGAVERLVLAAGWVATGLVAWSRLLHRALVRPPSRGGEVRRRADALLPARGTGTRPGLVAADAVLRRALRYWVSDPRYLSSLLGAVVAPVAIVLLTATVVDAPAAVALSMGPLMAGTIGWGRHNDLAFDGSAFWMHVVAQVPGWADRLGRSAATVVWAGPLTVGVGVAGALVGGRSELWPAAVGASLGVLGVGLAVSAVFNPLLPYPVPGAGANPYAAQMGAVGASMVAQVVTSMASTLLALPVLVLFVLSLWRDPGLAPLTLVAGAAWGAAALALGTHLGGRVYDARAARVLARLG